MRWVGEDRAPKQLTPLESPPRVSFPRRRIALRYFVQECFLRDCLATARAPDFRLGDFLSRTWRRSFWETQFGRDPSTGYFGTEFGLVLGRCVAERLTVQRIRLARAGDHRE